MLTKCLGKLNSDQGSALRSLLKQAIIGVQSRCKWCIEERILRRVNRASLNVG